MEVSLVLWHTRFRGQMAVLRLVSIFKFGYRPLGAQVPRFFNADVVELVDTQDLKS